MTNKISAATPAIDPTIEQAVQELHRIVTQRGWDALPALVVDDVTYHNPAQFDPYRGKDALVSVLWPVDVVAKLGAEAARRMAAASDVGAG